MSKISEAAAAKGLKDVSMAFHKPHFLKGLNVTIRNGLKWKEELNPGDTILCVDTGGGVINNARVVATEAINIRKFPGSFEYLVRFEHDHTARTLDGLKAALDKAYGPNRWGPTVTVVAFWIDDIDPNSHSGHSGNSFCPAKS